MTTSIPLHLFTHCICGNAVLEKTGAAKNLLEQHNYHITDFPPVQAVLADIPQLCKNLQCRMDWLTP